MRPRATTALILALAAGVAIGCGSDDEGGDPIPAEQAAALERQLESIQNRFQVGGAACGDITGGVDPNTVPVRTAIESLPRRVDPEVRTALENGFERLFELVQEQCDTQQGQEEEPPAPVETQPTETIPPEDDEGDDEGEDEEAPPPPETGPTGTEPPAEAPPEVPPEQDGSLPPGQDGSLPPGQGGSAPGNSGEGGSGAAGQGGGGGAVVPGDVP